MGEKEPQNTPPEIERFDFGQERRSTRHADDTDSHGLSLWADAIPTIAKVALGLKQHRTYRYFNKLADLAKIRQENQTLIDFAVHCSKRLPVHNAYALPDLPTYGEQIYTVEYGSDYTPVTTMFSLEDNQQFNKLEWSLQPVSSENTVLKLIILPEISSASISLLGQALNLDYRVFAKQLWTRYQWPLKFARRDEENEIFDLRDPNNTISLEFDSPFCALKDFYRYDNRRHQPSKPVLLEPCERPLFKDLPLGLGYWPSRATIHVTTNHRDEPIVVILLSPVPRLHALQRYAYGLHPLLEAFQGTRRPSTWQIPNVFYEVADLYHEPCKAGQSPYITSLKWMASSWIEATTKAQAGDEQLVKSSNIIAKMRSPETLSTTIPSEHGADTSADALSLLNERAKNRIDSAAYLEGKLRKALGRSDSRATDTQDLHPLLLDLATLRQRAREFIRRLDDERLEARAQLQHRLALLQIEESRKSIAQNERIKNLTVLAFIFLPISLTSSLFGMNVAELVETSAPRIWLFFVCAAAVTFLTIFVASFGALRTLMHGTLYEAHRDAAYGVYVCKLPALWACIAANFALLPAVVLWDMLRLAYARGKARRAHGYDGARAAAATAAPVKVQFRACYRRRREVLLKMIGEDAAPAISDFKTVFTFPYLLARGVYRSLSSRAKRSKAPSPIVWESAEKPEGIKVDDPSEFFDRRLRAR